MATSPGAPTHPDFVSVDPLELERVEGVVRTLDKALRAFQLYEGSSPTYERFVDHLKLAFLALWELLPSLAVDVQEASLAWEGRRVYEGQQRQGDFAFLLHRDGIRQLVFRPGFEEHELGAFLALLARAPRIRADEDDLITLFWEQDFAFFDYRHVDVSLDGTEVPSYPPGGAPSVDPAMVRREIAERGVSNPDRRAPGAEALATLSPPDFQETLHFLDPSDLRVLQDEVRRELERDLIRDVLLGLMDRLQDGTTERQCRVIGAFAELLPGLLSAGRFRDAVGILQEMTALGTQQPAPPREVMAGVRELFVRLGEPATVQEIVRTVEDSPGSIRIEECAALLGYCPPTALEPLIEAAERAERPEVRRTLQEVTERVAASDPNHLRSLLAADSPLLAAGGARLVGRLGVADAAPALARLLQRPEPTVRIAAVHALQELRVATAASALMNALEDDQREVRIAAARALGALRYPPARQRLEALLKSRQARDADVTERIAFFEAFGHVAGAAGVPLLDGLLNGKGWLGRREPAEVRAAAAMGLARIDHPDAAASLRRAAQDPEAVVRNAVARAVRGEGR